jgi:hypothetical protein
VPNFISEDQIERALVQKLQKLHGFDSLDCYTEDPENLHDGSGRAHKRDVILVDRVKEAAILLNPDIPSKAIDDALEKLLDQRQAMSLVAANQENKFGHEMLASYAPGTTKIAVTVKGSRRWLFLAGMSLQPASTTKRARFCVTPGLCSIGWPRKSRAIS